MKKRLLSLFLVLCLALSLLPVLPVGAARSDTDVPYAVTGGNLYFDKETGTITDCDQTVTAANIPAKIDGVAVQAIGEGAFWDCINLTSVTIPAGVTTIEKSAFSGCSRLTALMVPNGVTVLSEFLFSNCDALTSVTIPDSVTQIKDNAFYHCDGLTSVTIPAGVTQIGKNAFYHCNALRAVYFRGDAPQLGEEVFYTFSGMLPVKLYYIEGKSGWTSPTWNGYPTGTWDGTTASDPCENGHTWSAWTVSKAATCTAAGEETRTCSVCGEKEVRESKALGHNYQNGVCTRCGAKDPNASQKPTGSTFTDVPANAWFAGAVDYAVKNGLMNGMGNNQFQPNTSMTRAMLVTVLWRYAKEPKQGRNTFSDVPSGKYYTDAVAWAAANGIVNGVGNGKFNPDGNITREQLVTILYRYCKQLNIDTNKADALIGFPDAGNVGNSAKDAMRWAVAEKLIGGKTLDASGTVYLQPKGSATRAEVATILMRFIENILK